MVFQVAIYSFLDTIPAISGWRLGDTIFILFEKRGMAVSIVCRETLPLSCPDCYLNYTEWVYSHTDKIVKFCQDHGLIKQQCFKVRYIYGFIVLFGAFLW